MTNALAPKTRKLASWIESFAQYLDDSPSPALFIRWAAIATLAGAMERRLWTHTYGSNLYPNLFTFLVGTPGGGKTFPIKEAVRPLWKSIADLFVSPTSMTSASLSDDLNAAKRRIVRPAAIPPYVEFNSLQIALNELSIMFPAYDGELMNRFTDLYDCDVYEETRRAKSIKISIPNSQVNLIAATTPSYLNELMPPGAWDQGFISRVIMVFSGEKIIKPLFSMKPRNPDLFKALSEDLKVIMESFGQFKWESAAVSAMENWARSGGPPIPDHPRLQHYNSRRNAHLLKLSMVASIARGDNGMTVTLADFQNALGWLVEVEYYMPDIFKSMITGGDSAAMDEVYHFVFSIYAKEKKPLAEHRIVRFISERVPAHSVMRVFETMFKSNMLEVESHDAQGRNLWKPVARGLSGRSG